MKKKSLMLAVVGLLLLGGPAFAADGDLIVYGKIGLGTPSPGDKLTAHLGTDLNLGLVQGTFPALASHNDAWSAWGNLQLNNAMYLIGNTGNVGIGTSAPAAKLHVFDGDITASRSVGTVSLVLHQQSVGDQGKWLIASRAGTQPNLGFYNVQYAPTHGWQDVMTLLYTGNVGIGYNSPGYNLHVSGSFAATSKSFDIPDPRYNDESQRLVHASLEGPEVGVYYRGEDKLKDGKAVIMLPDYFEALTRKEDRTVLLTPKFDIDNEPVSNLASSAVVDGNFSVRAVGSANPNQKFYWEVKAVRADVESLQVELKNKKYKEKGGI